MEYICTSCNYVGERKLVKPGSTALEIFLWVALFIPGPFYTIWRIIKKRYACPNCGETVMVPSVNNIIKRDKLETPKIETQAEPEIKNPVKPIQKVKKVNEKRDNNKQDNNEW